MSLPTWSPMVLSDQLADYAQIYHPVERQILDQMVTQLYENHKDNLIHFCLELHALFHRQMPSNLISALVYQTELPYDPPKRPTFNAKIKHMPISDFHSMYGKPLYTWENSLYDIKVDELGLYKSQVSASRSKTMNSLKWKLPEPLNSPELHKSKACNDVYIQDPGF